MSRCLTVFLTKGSHTAVGEVFLFFFCLGNFDPVNVFSDNENISFSGLPKRYFG